MTSKQRAYLKSLAMKMEPIMQIGKATVTPEITKSVLNLAIDSLVIKK